MLDDPVQTSFGKRTTWKIGNTGTEQKKFFKKNLYDFFQVLVRLDPRSFLESSSAMAESSEVNAFAKDKVETRNPKILKVLIFSKKKQGLNANRY